MEYQNIVGPNLPDDQPPPSPPPNVLGEVNRPTFGQKAAEKVAKFVGSWPFIIGQSIILVLWAALNITCLVSHWDPYPFILMNLFLSLQAAFTAPMILMAQNRQTEMDRQILYKDYLVDKSTNMTIKLMHKLDRHTNRMVKTVHDHLEWQDSKMRSILTHVSGGQEGDRMSRPEYTDPLTTSLSQEDTLPGDVPSPFSRS